MEARYIILGKNRFRKEERKENPTVGINSNLCWGDALNGTVQNPW